MNNGKTILGAILIIVAVWVFVTQTNPTTKYLGGIILLVLGLLMMAPAKRRSTPMNQPPVRAVRRKVARRRPARKKASRKRARKKR